MITPLSLKKVIKIMQTNLGLEKAFNYFSKYGFFIPAGKDDEVGAYKDLPLLDEGLAPKASQIRFLNN